MSAHGISFVFDGDEYGGHFIIQLICPLTVLPNKVGEPIEKAIELDGRYRQIFAGAMIVDAKLAGDSGVGCTVEM